MTGSTTPVEQVPGLPILNVEGSKFVVKKSTDEALPYDLILRVPSEPEYTKGIENVLDPTITSAAQSLLYERRIEVRKVLVANSTEVELTA